MAGDRIRLGVVRLTDMAPVVLAQAHGLFEAEGLDVSIQVEPSWANIADKLAWGLLEAAVMPPPLAIAMVLGLRGAATPLIVPAGISLNGNAITLSRRLAEAVLEEAPASAAAAAASLRRALPGRLRIAVVHGFSTHDLLLRRFLLAGGIDPAADVAISVVPPAEMAEALATGRIDGFCAGAPWGGVAAAAGAGRTIAVTSGIWPNHPEKCLALHGGWAAAHPGPVLALVRALLRAGRACDEAEHASSIASLLSRPEWVGVPAPLIAASLPGGSGGAVDRSVFAAHAAGVPFAAHARWFVRELARWREVPPGAAEAATAAYRSDLYAAAAMSLGLAAPPFEPPDTLPENSA